MNPEEHCINGLTVQVVTVIFHFSYRILLPVLEFTKCLSAYIVPNREDLDETAST